jgi:hypothetical protein
MSLAMRPTPELKPVRAPALGACRLETIENLPEEPAASWTQEHPPGELLAALPGHDHHHAEVIKRACAEAPSQPRTP